MTVATYRGDATIAESSTTGDISVALIAVSPNGAIDHELATVRGLSVVDDDTGVGGGP